MCIRDRDRKDDVVTFEQLGVDRLFVDEAHNYKNPVSYTHLDVYKRQDSTLAKLRAMTDAEFDELELYPDFDE